MMVEARADSRRAWPAPIDFAGRIGRAPFALVAVVGGLAMPLLVDLAALCAQAVGGALLGHEQPMALLRGVSLPSSVALPLLAVAALGVVVLALIILSFEVRRLHDMNVSGWLVLGQLALDALPFPDIDPLPSLAFVIWSALLAAVPGTNGANAYGPAFGPRRQG